MNEKIMEVLRTMQNVLGKEQLKELQATMYMVFGDCELVEDKEIMILEDTWRIDLEDFLMSKALEGKSRETMKRYRYELNRLLSYINKSVKTITDADISNYLRTYKKLCDVSNQTLKNVRSVYSSFFTWLRDRNRISKNPMLLVEDIKVEKKLQKAYSDEERELLLRNCTVLRDKAMMEFLYSTAVRVSELIKLDRVDVRFLSKDLIVFGKGSKERTVYLNDRANMYMREYLESRTDNNPALFVSLKSPYNRLTKSGIEDIVRRIGRKAGVAKSYPHRFRRTAATNALNRGMPVQEVSQMLGHAKLETTMVYCTVSEDSVKYHHSKYLSA